MSERSPTTAARLLKQAPEVLRRPLLLKVAEDAFPGLALAAFYVPARDEAEVGGDFYNAGKAIIDGARAHAGGAFQDDACLILARRV